MSEAPDRNIVDDNVTENASEAINQLARKKKSRWSSKRVKKAAVSQQSDRENDDTNQSDEMDEEIFLINKQIEGKEKKRFAVTVISLILVVCVCVVTVTAAITKLSASWQKNKSNDSNSIQVKPNSEFANNANYIYVNSSAQLGENNIKLIKFVADGLKTLFYFDGEIDYKNVAITLVDNMGRDYSMDVWLSKEASKQLEKSILAFAPLLSDVEGFDLILSGTGAGDDQDSIVFSFDFTEILNQPSIRFLDDKLNLYSDPDEFSIVITDAAFSSSGSFIDYSVIWENNSDGAVLTGAGPLFSLSEAYTTVAPMSSAENSMLMSGENMASGRAAFFPLRSLNGTVTLTVDNIYKSFDIGRRLSAVELYYSSELEPLEAGSYGIFLEDFRRYGDRYVLVCHTEDVNGERVQSEMSTTLTIRLADGGEIVIDGSVRSGREGSDIIFDFTEHKEKMNNNLIANLSLEIKQALIKCQPQSVEIDLKNCATSPNEEVRALSKFISDSFLSRLYYKAGNNSIGQITGFSAELINSNTFLEIYEPLNLESRGASCTVSIISCVIGENSFTATVCETLRAEDERNELHFSRTHIISGSKLSDINLWVIESDRIID